VELKFDCDGAKALENLRKHGVSFEEASKVFSDPLSVTISNPLVIVHGETASAELIFTEYVMEKQGDEPRIRTQGREYATFVKVKGQWRYKTRQIKGGTEPPEGWKE